jgi:hypothetical protein
MQAPQQQLHRPRMFKVLVPIEKKGGGTYWMRVGTGFPGKDASTLNLYIDAYPVGQKMLHVREMDEEDLTRRREGPSSSADAPSAVDDLPF